MAVITYPGATTYPGSTTYPGTSPDSSPTHGSGMVELVLNFQITVNPADVTASSGAVELVHRFDIRAFGSGQRSTLPSIAGLPQPNNDPPRFLIQASNITGAATATVTRTGPDGVPVPIRIDNPATLSGGEFLGYDYEAPFNTPVVYTITAGAQTIVSPPITMTVDRSWLIHPGVPGLSQPVNVSQVSERTSQSTAGVYQVLSRATPIVVSDGTRKAPAYSMGLWTDTEDEETKLVALLADTTPLLFQGVGATRVRYEWLAVGDASVAEPGGFDNPVRTWALPCTVVARPVGAVQAQRTWSTLMAECGTWTEVMARYSTWRGVLTGAVGT